MEFKLICFLVLVETGNLRSSLCYIGGYILRTKCHVGNTCIYDSKNKLNMTPSILKHRMGYIIKNIISQWKDDFPVCEKNITCSDCEQWATI
jgi:putative lipase involved disintegration of autophagic bodies